MQDAITVGIGLFITYIGIKNSGLLEFSVSGVTNGSVIWTDSALYEPGPEYQQIK